MDKLEAKHFSISKVKFATKKKNYHQEDYNGKQLLRLEMSGLNSMKCVEMLYVVLCTMNDTVGVDEIAATSVTLSL